MRTPSDTQWKGSGSSDWPSSNERSAEPEPLSQPRPRGRTEQHSADAPFRGRGPSTASADTRAVRLRVAVSGKQFLTLARLSKCHEVAFARPRLSSSSGLQVVDDWRTVCGSSSQYATRRLGLTPRIGCSFDQSHKMSQRPPRAKFSPKMCHIN